MVHSLRFLLAVPVLLAAGLEPAQAQCSRSSRSHCARPNSAESAVASVPAAPQRSVLLRVAVGASLSSSGDFPVLRAHVEYAPQLGQHARLGSRVAYLGGSEFKSYGGEFDGFTVPRSYRAVNAEQEIYWLPFGANKRVEFGVGGGAFLSYYRAVGVAAITYGLDANGNQTFSYVPRQVQNFHAGFITSLYTDVALDPAGKWRLGGRLSLQSGIYDALNFRLNEAGPGGQIQLSRAL